MQQTRQILGAADLHHLLHRLEVDPEIQGAGAHHPADVSCFHSGFDRFSLIPINGAVVEGQGFLHFRAGEAQTLMPSLRLIAGVGEQQRADVRVQARHQLFVHPQPQMASPGKSINVVGKDALDLRRPSRSSSHDQGVSVGAEGMAGRLLEVADRCADRPGLQSRAVVSQPAQAQLCLAAALAAHQLMPFIQNHRVE